MSEALTQDPVAAMKLLAIFVGFAGLYLQIRRWESRIGGKLEKIDIQQPLEVVHGDKVVTREVLDPVIHRVANLENEVRVIRIKMDADKSEIINAGEERISRMEGRFERLEGSLRADIKEVLRAVSRLEGWQHD